MACGVVEVKRVASVADLGIVASVSDDDAYRPESNSAPPQTALDALGVFPERFRLVVPREFLVADGSAVLGQHHFGSTTNLYPGLSL